MKRTLAKSTRAFTLIELILVLALIAIIWTVAVPMIANFERGQRVGDSADQIVALARWASTESVGRGISFRLNFDSAHGQYWVSMQNGASYENVLQDSQSSGLGSSSVTTTQTQFAGAGEEMGLKFSAPLDVRLDCSKIPPQPDGQYVEFRPTGRVDPGTIRVVDSRGAVIEVGCLSATENYHVLTADEKTLEQGLQQPMTGGPAR